MAILTKGQTFANADSVTSTKLNNLVDAAAFVAGASGTTDNTSLEVNGSGRLQVKDLGVTSAKLAVGAVTETKITDGSVTPAKFAAYGPIWSSSLDYFYVQQRSLEIGAGINSNTESYIDFHSSITMLKLFENLE